MPGNHDELEIFLKTRLISSRVDQKLKNKEGKYMLLKGELGPIFRPIEAVVGAVLRSRGSDSVVRQRDFNFAEISASILPPKVLRSGHDHFQFRFKNRPRSLQFRFENRRNFGGILRRASWL